MQTVLSQVHCYCNIVAADNGKDKENILFLTTAKILMRSDKFYGDSSQSQKPQFNTEP
ncbi:uncharacterized protein PHALS_13332 [Plasmopara halstedii]|uniref:Uncharacterized protein n=1 Tax=Plasmopara halstedii TaxID=4781 RepID=A0A0N7L628_PLAHL|nr:uncharacterized protein PHALS_13332 [Plasmopara halstedii]CEG43115.1 hypothetical protein PHALS_13332 [Plasmopara halstedii]|eukprot:XP_024579484.1 hypothetical protein PHALS_13332 [Plasmopara halstedii]